MTRILTFILLSLVLNGFDCNHEVSLLERISKLEQLNKRLNEVLHTQINTYDELLQAYVDQPNPKRYLDPAKRQTTVCTNKPSPIVFHAQINESIYPVGAKQIIPYSDVIANVGLGYDKYTGIFQARVHGVYEFIATMWSLTGFHVDFEMLHNGKDVCYGKAGSTNQTMGVCASVVEMEVGDRVWTRNIGGGLVYINGHNYPSFSGHLIV